MAVAGFVAAAGVAGLSAPAAAVALLNGNSLTVNGLNIAIANCTLTLGGVVQSSCAAGNLEIIPDSGPGASIRIQGAGGGNIFSAAVGSGLYDVTFILNISAIGGATTVSEARLGVAGSNTTGNPLNSIYVSAAESSVSTTPGFSMTGNLLTPDKVATFAPITSLSITKDLKLNTSSAIGSGTLTLAYVTQSYLPAPEPATIGLLLVGAGGLALARRRRARRAD